jgi:hypothetical protein
MIRIAWIADARERSGGAGRTGGTLTGEGTGSSTPLGANLGAWSGC